MKDAGIDYRGPIVADGKLHRVDLEGDRCGSKNGWYVYHGDDRPAGKFGSWKSGLSARWTMTGHRPLTPDERDKLRADMAAKAAANAKAEAERHARACARAAAIWNGARDAPADHPYLLKKGVAPYGIRVGTWVRELRPGPDGAPREQRTPNAIIVPIRDAAKKLVSLQAIFASPIQVGESTRSKDFLYGGQKRGCWHSIGKAHVLPDGRKLVLIVEGYATGATIHAATGYGVIVAFDAKNLRPVAEAVRGLMPTARIVICADNDQWKHTPVANPGVTYGREAAEAVGGEVVSPRFRAAVGKPTDFNDLALIDGAEAVKRQIAAVICLEPDEQPTAFSPTPAIGICRPRQGTSN
jgi:putative DNA primase/helicase